MTDSRTQLARLVSLQDILSGTRGYYKDSPHRDILPRLNVISRGLAIEDRNGLLEDCFGHRALAELCLGLYRSALQRVASREDPYLANDRFLNRIFAAWEILDRYERESRQKDSAFNSGAACIVASLHETTSVYLGLAGYPEARPAMMDVMWRLARPEGATEQRIARRAFGLSLLHDMDWPDQHPGIRYPDMLLVADDVADRLLGAAEPQTAHAEQTDDDRAGIVRVPAGPMLDRLIAQSLREPLAAPGVVVFPKSILDSIGKSENKRETKGVLGDVLGRELPLIPVPKDWDEWERARLSAFPWAHRAIRAFRTAQAGRTHFGIAVLLLHGSPGCGKSALARELAESCGLKFVRYQADASSENSYAGTTVRWQSGHLGILEAAIAAAKTATVCVSIDEIEKASGSRRSNGGTLHDSLHGTWELETARAWTSPFLLHPVDVSHTVYVCTANDQAGIPASLRDRMTLVEVPEPSGEHLSILAPRVAQALCRERGLDEGWATFDSVEWASLREGWKGGSIRTLQTCVETVFRVRDELPLAARGPLN